MEVMRCTMVRPSAPHALAGQKVPLTVFDHTAVDRFVPMVSAYPAPAPSNKALKDGLVKAVGPYPHLVGRLVADDRGRRFLHVNNEGVAVVEASLAMNLEDVLVDGGRIRVDVVGLYPAIPEEHIGAALLHIQLNRFMCGGLVIGLTFHHHACDGLSISTFWTTWGSAVREAMSCFVPPSPLLDREATAVPRSSSSSTVPRRAVELVAGEASSAAAAAAASYYYAGERRTKNLTLHFAADLVVQLKARAGRRCSTFQCLLAHVWRSITAARVLGPEEFTKVSVGVNCRGRANPPIPTDFFGNMVLRASPRLQVRDLLSWTYGEVIGVIQDALARIDADYIQSVVDLQLQGTSAAAGVVRGLDIEVESWLGFKFHQIDFGNGPPAAFMPPDLPVEGLMVFVPSCKAKGDVDLYAAVAEEHVAAFLHLCYSLD